MKRTALPNLDMMGLEDNQISVAIATSSLESKAKKKICSVCPETKRLRDECVVQHGEDACGKWIEAHLKGLRAKGFNV